MIPYIPIDSLDLEIMKSLHDFLPTSIFESVETTLTDIINRPRGGLLSFGFLFAIFAATNGMSSLMTAFNMALKQREKRSYLKAK